VFESILVVTFQNAFYLEIYQNNIFLKLFLILAYKNDQKIKK